MQIEHSRILPWAISVLAVWLVYRRLRRSFGRQPLRVVQMSVRIGVLAVLGCVLLPAAMESGRSVIANVAGLSAGTALGFWAARRTRYQNYGGRLHYIPHTYSGVAVSLLFVGRLAYRWVTLYSIDPTKHVGAETMRQFGSPITTSPFTTGLLFVVIGYYLCYYGLVLWKSKHLSPQDLETPGEPI